MSHTYQIIKNEKNSVIKTILIKQTVTMLSGQRMLTDLWRKKCLIIKLVLDPSH